MFESADKRDVAAGRLSLVEVMEENGLVEGATVVDVGAGTGLLLNDFSRIAGRRGKVLAIDISSKFCGARATCPVVVALT